MNETETNFHVLKFLFIRAFLLENKNEFAKFYGNVFGTTLHCSLSTVQF